MKGPRRGLSKRVAVIFFALTWIALIVAVVFDDGTLPIILHAIVAALGLAAIVIAWRAPTAPKGGWS